MGAAVSGIQVFENNLLVTSLDNFVYLISFKGGNILWKKRFPGRIHESVLLKDKFAVISVFGEKNAQIIELEKGQVVDQIMLSDANFFFESPVRVNDQLIFPTLKGIYSFSSKCKTEKKAD